MIQGRISESYQCRRDWRAIESYRELSRAIKAEGEEVEGEEVEGEEVEGEEVEGKEVEGEEVEGEEVEGEENLPRRRFEPGLPGGWAVGFTVRLPKMLFQNVAKK